MKVYHGSTQAVEYPWSVSDAKTSTLVKGSQSTSH